MHRHRRSPKQSAANGPRLTLRKKVAFSVASVLLFFLMIEVALRMTGLGTPPVVGALRFGYETGIPRFDSDGIEREGQPFQDYPLFEADPILFWKPIAGTPFTGPDGLRLPAPEQQAKPQGVYRVGIVGDSCSFLGSVLYPQRFAELAQGTSSRQIEVINASCPGYTSFQGLRRLKDVWPWSPDLIVVYFGWNDHWNSLNGRTDEELASLRVFEPLHARLQHAHTYWALSRLVGGSARQAAPQVRTVRVPLDDYRRNLRQIAQTAKQRNCRVVFVTAPTALVDNGLPDWASPFFSQYYEMTLAEIRGIPATHRRYNDVVREVAAQEGQLVLDLAGAWPPEHSAQLFRRDCIHLTEQGHQQAAEALFELWQTSIGNRAL